MGRDAQPLENVSRRERVHGAGIDEEIYALAACRISRVGDVEPKYARTFSNTPSRPKTQNSPTFIPGR